MTLERKVAVSTAFAIATLLVAAGPTALAGAPAFYSPPPAEAQVESHHAEAPPYAGTQNYGSQVKPFRYGWFGAEHFYPTNRSHQTYYGDVMRWSRWRRY